MPCCFTKISRNRLNYDENFRNYTHNRKLEFCKVYNGFLSGLLVSKNIIYLDSRKTALQYLPYNFKHHKSHEAFTLKILW